jgi:hypothetical protein
MFVKAFILNRVRPTIARNDNYQSEGKWGSNGFKNQFYEKTP